jgi:hypothetical protein
VNRQLGFDAPASSACIVLICALVVAPAGAQIAPVFAPAVVDAGGDVGRYAAIAVGTDTLPRIAYFDATNGDLKYAVKVSPEWWTTDWNLETVDADGDVGAFATLALGLQGEPQTAYFDATLGDLKYAVRGGTGWTIERVETAGVVGRHCALALDGEGNPHVAYLDDTQALLKLAVKAGGIWQVETVCGVSTDVRGIALALDLQDAPTVCFSDAFLLRLAVRTPTGWEVETLAAQGSWVGESSVSMAFDGPGDPHVSFYGDHALRRAVRVDGRWTIEDRDARWDVGRFSALALAGGSPGSEVVAYSSDGLGDLLCFGEFGIAVADEGPGEEGGFVSLALDPRYFPHIGYYEATSGDLKYSTPYFVGGIGDRAVAPRVTLAAPVPNPWRPGAPLTVTFRLPAETGARLELFDLAGRLVTRDVVRWLGPGQHRRTWDPGALTPGLYILRLSTTAGASAGTRLTVLR